MAIIVADLDEGTRATIRAREFSWLSDEPIDSGGGDTGPTPYELLLGSLAACIALTLRLYSSYKGLSLHSVRVELEFDRVHSHDCERCDERIDGRVERIQSSVTIRGDFDKAQKQRLTQIATRCPVHKTLTNGMQIFDNVNFESAG